MSSPTIEMKEIVASEPYLTMRGHTGNVNGVVHLPSGQRIITCSRDGSLRLWDLESGTQIGEDWRDGVVETRVSPIALFPDGSTVASGSGDGTMRLWDVKTGKINKKWKGHIENVLSVCWSTCGDRVMSRSLDGTARVVWDAKTGETVLDPIETRNSNVFVVIYSPDSTKFATGSYINGANIWDVKTGDLLT